jgi:glycosyltransferase involved in cell wall biosynthesis
MHIALTCNFSPWSRYRGGGQRATHLLASALAEHGHDVSVIFTKPPWEQVEVPSPLPYRLFWAALPHTVSRRDAPLRPLTAFSVAHAVRALARERPLDVVHSQGEEGVLVDRVVRCPLVLTPRYPAYPDELFTPSRSWLRRARFWIGDHKYVALTQTARRATLVCTTSHYAARTVEAALRVDPSRLHVVPNGIDASFFAVERAPRAATGPVLFFGRVMREKGIDTLLSAFAGSAHRDRELHVVGEGDEPAALARAVRETGIADRVRFFPWESPSALRARLAQAALAVLPSREESFGNAMAETMAAGTPLVTTTAGSLPELVDSGRTGFLVPPGDAEALRSAMDELLADPVRAEALGRAGRSAMQARYSWQQVAKQYEEIYVRARARAGAAP